MEETINERLEIIVNKRFNGNKSAFAKVVGINPNTLANYFGSRHSKPNIEHVINVVKILHVDPLWLLTGEETPSRSVKTHGDYSPGSVSGDMSVVIGDAILAEKVNALEALVKEKDERIAVLNALVAELKAR